MRADTTPAGPAVHRSGPGRQGVVPMALVTLGLIPLVAGLLRLVQLAGGPDLMPADPRFASTSAPLVAHIVGAGVFVLVGALQFVPALRRRGRRWHRLAGRVVVASGLTVGLSAIWMTLLYPQKAGTGDVLFVLRLGFGSALIGCLVLGVVAIRGHDVDTHRAWMMRAYAIGLGAGTQALTEGVSGALFGHGALRDDLAKGMGWVINLAVAEWFIRRGARPRPDVAATARAGAHR